MAGREMLKGCVEPLILAILRDEETYGYLLAKQISQRSDHAFALKDGTLYPALKRLEHDGLVESFWGRSDGGARRRYYRITNAGRAYYQDWVGDWTVFMRSMNSVLGAEP